MTEAQIAVLKESFGRVVYSHKTQEKAKEINECRAVAIKWMNIALVGVTSISAAYNLIASPDKVFIITTILSAISLMFVVAQLSFDPESRARANKSCADKLWLIRERYINLISDAVSGNLTEENFTRERDNLAKDLFQAYDDAPIAGGLAYKRARKALKIDKELTFSPKEVDQFLPESVKSSSTKSKL